MWLSGLCLVHCLAFPLAVLMEKDSKKFLALCRLNFSVMIADTLYPFDYLYNLLGVNTSCTL